MQTVSFLTADDLAPLMAMVQQVLANQSAAQPADDYLPVEQVAALTHTSVHTVRKWLKEGKADQKGKTIKLFALEFSPGYPRIPRSALLAFGQAQGFDASMLTRVATGAPVATAKTKKTPVLDSSQALSLTS